MELVEFTRLTHNQVWPHGEMVQHRDNGSHPSSPCPEVTQLSCSLYIFGTTPNPPSTSLTRSPREVFKKNCKAGPGWLPRKEPGAMLELGEARSQVVLSRASGVHQANTGSDLSVWREGSTQGETVPVGCAAGVLNTGTTAAVPPALIPKTHNSVSPSMPLSHCANTRAQCERL